MKRQDGSAEATVDEMIKRAIDDANSTKKTDSNFMRGYERHAKALKHKAEIVSARKKDVDTDLLDEIQVLHLQLLFRQSLMWLIGILFVLLTCLLVHRQHTNYGSQKSRIRPKLYRYI